MEIADLRERLPHIIAYLFIDSCRCAILYYHLHSTLT